MGNHDGWAQPNGIMPSGLLPKEVASVTCVLDPERWAIAEEKTAELIQCIQPNQPSEERRNAVANYVQRLITKCFSGQVFTFGSVPLKTYLPDGDIDVTAFSKNLNLKDTWANEVRDVLEHEEKSENAEFHVKEVQYIQAEVKIIKCLVENIVVDISFNQLGGLCTLCFLEEIDQLINQDHLFKRSIILIKAWCYYESRILGAHHGLISTYALETLVLYIFHVFNNSFAGPLEVLYRFLEFFSNFDWDNFCVSLWGPVPISSLPDMTAEPPRKDSGELLLNRIFLDACSRAYAVFPGPQENLSQPFVSKFFNVIDPLRTNNNLGRSVSKGNFYRIRSAFAFGAKRLGGLLDCRKENIIAEVNKFFTNTWKRHGNGHRPDAPSRELWHLRPINTDSVEESENSKNRTSTNWTENVGLPSGHGFQVDGKFSFHRISSQPMNTMNQPTQNIYRTSTTTVLNTNSQKNYDSQASSRVSDQIERSISSSEAAQADKSRKSSRPDHHMNDYEGQGKFHFARTRSSPELTDTSIDVLSRGRREQLPETGKSQTTATSTRQDHRTSIRNNSRNEVSSGHSVRSSTNDHSSLMHSSSNQSLDASAASDSYQDHAGCATAGEEYASVSEKLEIRQEMDQEEQDLVNMMASSRVHNVKHQVQLPMNIPSAHLTLPLSPSVLASMAYSHRNLAGMLPANIPLTEPCWGANMQFAQGLIPSPASQYFPNAGLESNQEEVSESGSESSGMRGMNREDGDHGLWQDQDVGSTRRFFRDNRNFQMLNTDNTQSSTMGGFGIISTSRVSNTGGSRGQHKFVREREDYNDAVQYQSGNENDDYPTDRMLNTRFMPASQTSSSRSKTTSESSWDDSSMRVSTRSLRDKRGRKPAHSMGLNSLYGKAKSGWQYDNSSSDHVSVPTDDEDREWIPLSTMGTDVAVRSAGSPSLAPSHLQSHPLPGYEVAPISGSDSVIPLGPMLVTAGSRHREGDNSGVYAFYPTGPPVPFLTMVPLLNFNSESGNSDGPTSRFDRDDVLDNSHLHPSDQNFDPPESREQPDVHVSSCSLKAVSHEHSEEHKSDILNGDFFSHWQNLQYGRLCQNTRHHGPLVYPSPVMVPPMYLQGHFPWDGPGRPVSANSNLFTQIMNYGPRLFPVAPLQPRANRPPSAYQSYGDEVPRYRGGTGTYLPNPKVSFRDRQSPSTRNHRGNYGYDRSDPDREASWITSKSRAAARGRGRHQVERPGSRTDRISATDSRGDRSWDSYRHEPVAPYQTHNNSFGSTSSMHGSAYVNSNGVNSGGPAVPSVVMLYSYDSSTGYGSSAEQLEFGSLGPVHLSGMTEITQPRDGGVVKGGAYEQRHGVYQGGSPHSSPDQPSSPRLQRAL